MSTFKKYLLLFLVVMAFLATGLGGLPDMLGIQLVVTKQHGWNDGIFLMLTAILVALTVQ